jgi:excisionase family DNA binding protein
MGLRTGTAPATLQAPRTTAEPSRAYGTSVDEILRCIVREELRPLREQLAALTSTVERRSDNRGEFLSVKGAATIASVSSGTVRGWISSGRLQAHRAGRLLRVRRDDLIRLLSAPPSAPTERATAAEQAIRILAGRKARAMPR